MFLVYLIPCIAILLIVLYINKNFSMSEQFKKEFNADDKANKYLTILMCFIPVINIILLIFYLAKYIDAKLNSKL